MNDHVHAVIMAGGKGERFWPLSTAARPKQVLSLVGGKPMIALTVDYLGGLVPPERVFVITNAALAPAIRKALPMLPPENIVGEPFGRDTAAACALGLCVVGKRDPEGVICTLTADHVIGNAARFRELLGALAGMAAERDALMTIGIPPASPSTGFGYIEAGDGADSPGGIDVFRAKRFVEKPDRATAVRYVEAGNYFWNSGIFVWSAATFGKALATWRPPLAEMVERLCAVPEDDLEPRLGEEYARLEKISVDYAVMERAPNILMARGDFGWDDVGSWPALANHCPVNASSNVLLGRVETLAAHDNIVVSPDRLTALIGVQDLVVVQAEGATLVCHRDRAQDVKQMVQQLREDGRYDDLL